MSESPEKLAALKKKKPYPFWLGGELSMSFDHSLLPNVQVCYSKCDIKVSLQLLQHRLPSSFFTFTLGMKTYEP